MIKKIGFRKILAMLLVALFFVQSSIPIYAMGGGYQNIEGIFYDPHVWVANVLELQEQMLLDAEMYAEISEDGNFEQADTFQAIQAFDETELIYGMPYEIFESLSDEIQQELAGLELLASQIFAYYEQHGYIPDEEAFLNSLPVFGRATMVISPDAAVTIFRSKGFTVSAFAVSSTAAWIGSAIGLTAAIPIIQVVALVAGTTIIAGGVVLAINAAVNNRVAISAQLHGMLGNSNAWQRRVAENAITQTQQLDQARRSGHEHFVAARNWTPGGGILIGRNITRTEAVTRLRNTVNSTGFDTFSVNQMSAMAVAVDAGNGRMPVLDEPHNTATMPLNLPHFHPGGLPAGNNDHLTPRPHAFFIR